MRKAMSTFKEADQVRVALKMKLAQYSWYKSCTALPVNDGYGIVVVVKRVDNTVRKIIAPVIDGVTIKVESE